MAGFTGWGCYIYKTRTFMTVVFKCPHYEIIPPSNVILVADLYLMGDGVIREVFWELFVKYNSVGIGPPRIEGNIIGEMENLETDLVRGEHRLRSGASQDVLSLRTKMENSTSKFRNGLRTLAILYPNNLL